ncbi:hypothetical protein WN51_00998, partial [Melipona quadrifasciata]
TRQKLMQLGWDVLSSDFYLFRSLQSYLNGKNFDSLDDCKDYLEQFISQKNATF